MSDFSTTDIWAIARAVQGLETWKDLKVSPAVNLLLDNLKQPKDRMDLLRLLGPELSQEILAIPDPNAEPPAPKPKTNNDEPSGMIIPELPKEARLNDAALKAAEGVGRWVDNFLTWSVARSPMTPPDFLLAGALFAIGTAIARRCVIHIHEPIYPHFFILWVARTSVYKKTTGLRCIFDLLYRAMPHMLFPEELTPEAFVGALAGRLPTNYDKLTGYDKRLIDNSLPHAAQRGIILDEASSLFGSSKKDYMAGSEELLLRGYDAPKYYSRETTHEGRLIIKNMALSLLGATTPAAFSRTVDSAAWETGLTARFIMCYPTGKMPYKTTELSPDQYEPPSDLVKRLQYLHMMLPIPPSAEPLEDTDPPERVTMHAHVEKSVFPVFNAYSRAVTYDLLWAKLDPMLHGNYARLSVGAEKVALALAAIDWADNGAKGKLQIQLGHWAKAQQIAEAWRASLHRMHHALSSSKDSQDEEKILWHLESWPQGETARELGYRTGLSRKAIQDALQTLIESGLVAATPKKSKRGPDTVIYMAIEP